MTIADIRVLEAITKLHEVARVVEQDVGNGPLSNSIRCCADSLNDIIKAKTCTEK